MKMVVAILAGGQGSRIGGNKPLRRLAGDSLLHIAKKQACRWSNQIIMVVRDPAKAAEARAPVIVDHEGIEGPLGGVAAALEFGREEQVEAVLTIAVDMPFLPSDLGPRLAAALGQKRAAVPSSGGFLHPICGLWRPSALEGLSSYLDTGKRSLTGFAEAVGFHIVEWPDRPTDPFFNINSVQDLARAERLRGR